MTRQQFHGFDPHDAERTLAKVQRRTEQPVIHQLHDVIALPGVKALYRPNGCRIDVAAPSTISTDAPTRLTDKVHARTPVRVPIPANVNVVEEPFLFGGFLTAHYGHFLIDGMSRLWARNLFPSMPILCTTDTEVSSFRHEILDALGLVTRIVYVEEPTLFRSVVCPGTAFEYRWKVFSVADEPHINVAAALQGRGNFTRPAYVSRMGLTDRTKAARNILAEAELAAELGKRGFDVIHPETLPLKDQKSLFEQAPLIVGTIGSAFHTALFCTSPVANLAILNWGRGYENFLLVDAIKRHRSYYINSIQRRAADGEHALDVGLSLLLLKDAGLI